MPQRTESRETKIREMKDRILEMLGEDGEAGADQVAEWLGCSPNYWAFEDAWMQLDAAGKIDDFRPPEPWPSTRSAF